MLPGCWHWQRHRSPSSRSLSGLCCPEWPSLWRGIAAPGGWGGLGQLLVSAAPNWSILRCRLLRLLAQHADVEERPWKSAAFFWRTHEASGDAHCWESSQRYPHELPAGSLRRIETAWKKLCRDWPNKDWLSMAESPCRAWRGQVHRGRGGRKNCHRGGQGNTSRCISDNRVDPFRRMECGWPKAQFRLSEAYAQDEVGAAHAQRWDSGISTCGRLASKEEMGGLHPQCLPKFDPTFQRKCSTRRIGWCRLAAAKPQIWFACPELSLPCCLHILHIDMF